MRLKQKALIHFRSCLFNEVKEKNRSSEIDSFLCELKLNGYKLQPRGEVEVYEILVEWNVLFFDFKVVLPQNRLLEHAIDDYLIEYSICTK